MKQTLLLCLTFVVGALSLTSTAFAYNQVPVDVTVKDGDIIHLDFDATSYYNVNFFGAGGGTISFKFDFTTDAETGYLSVVETPKPRPEFTTGNGVAWVSRTPGGEPIHMGSMSLYNPKYEAPSFVSWGPLRFYHPSLRAKGGRYATEQFEFLEHGTYYYNIEVEGPAGFNIVYQRTRPQGWYTAVPSGVAKRTPLVCTKLGKDLEFNDDDPDVKKLQEFLNASNLAVNVLFGPGAPGEESTFYGVKTKIAVERFQKQYGIIQTGIAGPITRAKIEQVSCGGMPTTTPALPSTAPEPSDSPTVGDFTIVMPKAGDILSNAGACSDGSTSVRCNRNPIGQIFWNYDNATARITIELHDEDGFVRTIATKTTNSGRYTWSYTSTLRDGDYKLVFKAYSTIGTLLTTAETGFFEVSKVKEAQVSVLPSEEIFARAISSVPEQANVVIERVNFFGLGVGSDERRVSALKEVLRTIPATVSEGCANLNTANTKYGPTTEACVKAFQGVNGLSQTGTVDEVTNRALNTVLGKGIAMMPMARGMAVMPMAPRANLASVNTVVTLQSLYALLAQLQEELKSQK